MNTKRLQKLSDIADRASVRARRADPPSAHLNLVACSKRLDVAVEMAKLLNKETKDMNGIYHTTISYNTRCVAEEIKWVQQVIIPSLEGLFALRDKLKAVEED